MISQFKIKHFRCFISLYCIVPLSFLIFSLFSTPSSSAETVTANITHTNYYVNLVSASSTTGLNLSLTPSSSSSIVGTIDRLTVKTNAKNGYKVYAAALNHNKLYHSGSPTSDPGKIINPTSGTHTSPSPLSDNTWGYAIRRTDPKATANNFSDSYSSTVLNPSQSFTPSSSVKWAALPASTSGLAHLFSGSKNSHTGGDQLDIYYAAKVNTSLSAGSYSGTIRYTAVADNSTTPVGMVTPSVIIASPDETVPITITIPLYTSYKLDSNQIAVQVDNKSCANLRIIKNDNIELKVTCTPPFKPEGGNARVVINVPVFAAPIEITGGINYRR